MLVQIKESLKNIKCNHTANALESTIELAKQKDLSYLEFIHELLNHEISNRKKTQIKRFLKMTNFPCIKTIDEFDFKFQTTISKKEVNEWLTFSWIDQRKNKILMGPPGVGKTHLVLGVGFAAIHKGYKVIFYSMQMLMEEMILAEQGGHFKDFIKKVLKYDLLIIDELGYLPLKPIYANIFFQLVSHFYEFRSIMITSNKIFTEWGALFGDQSIAGAILDRLLHHSDTIVLNGDSYRLRDRGSVE